MVTNRNIDAVIGVLRHTVRQWEEPVEPLWQARGSTSSSLDSASPRSGRPLDACRATSRARVPGRGRGSSRGVVGRYRTDPFTTLISCLLSLRTKDETTRGASERLFRRARTPRQLLELSWRTIERVIYPVGFYRTKARTLRAVCRTLLSRYGGRVPSTLEELLTIKGVGRKTANLVVTLAFDKPGICVDTHVHRISNRWGYVRTQTPEQTETALRRKLPPRHWRIYNDLLVSFGQHLCHPTSPWCSRCPLARRCAKVSVRRSR